MDPRLLRLYSDELTHLREVGAEFASEFPKIASRLTMEGLEVTDPYVERLLEGFAFMAARVQLKLEAEQPRLIAQLLETIYPNFLAPLPSMMVARLQVDLSDPGLSRGFAVPRGSALMSELPRGQATHCEFRTAHAVTLWPIELTSVRYFSHAPDLPLARLPHPTGSVRGGLRIRLQTGAGGFARLGVDRLSFYLSAPDEIAWRLHELVLGGAVGTYLGVPGARPDEPGAAAPASRWRGAESIRPCGFSASEALLPESLRAFSGYRLLQEVAALPQRLLFFEVTDLAARLAQVEGDTVDLVVLLGRGDATLEAHVDAASLALYCTPAINLFKKRLDRIQLGPGAWEYHVVPDRTRPMDYEVHSLESVVGFGNGRVPQQRFMPLYATFHDDAGMPGDRDAPGSFPGGAADATAGRGAGGGFGEQAGPHAHGYYTVRREPRLLSSRQRQHGMRSAYVGEELYLALVDPHHAPYRDDIRQLSVSAWVSNRDLPTLLPQARGAVPAAEGLAAHWRLEAPGPVSRVEAMRGPTRPMTRRPVGELGWRLVSHLTLNHLSLVGESPERAASALRTMLALYAPPEDAGWVRHTQGVRSLTARTVVRRLPFKGPLTFGSGIEIVLELDDLAYQGSSAFVFASVLERFFARHAAINSFTQLTLRTAQRGEVMRWPPRIGMRETV